MERTWKISWFIGKAKTKSVFKTVNTSDYSDRYMEREELRDQAYIDHNLHPDKIVMIKEVK